MIEHFQGFGSQALNFFRALAFHQDREWMAENKELYEREIRAPMGLLLDDLTAEFARRGVPLCGSLKTSTFRLNRDVRFSKDKSLYKTAAGAVLTRSGVKGDQGLVYLHLDPKGCFMACGVYRPLPVQLAEIRQDIVNRAASFRDACARMTPTHLSREDALTRAPRGFDKVADMDLAAALRLKSLIFQRTIADEAIFSPELVHQIAEFAQSAEPFLRFCWNALDRVPLDERAEAPRKGRA